MRWLISLIISTLMAFFGAEENQFASQYEYDALIKFKLWYEMTPVQFDMYFRTRGVEIEDYASEEGFVAYQWSGRDSKGAVIVTFYDEDGKLKATSITKTHDLT